MAAKKRTMNELRQTKDTAYTPPVSHVQVSHAKKDSDIFKFSRVGLKKLLEDFQSSDESVEDFVNSII